MAGAPSRRTLVRLIRYFVTRPAALISAVLLLVVVVAGAIFLPPMLLGNEKPVAGLSLLRPGVDKTTATSEYLEGNRSYNADLVWQSLSDDARERFTNRGGSVDDLRRQMQAARAQGMRLEDFSYIGGKDLPDGTSVQFYLVAVRAQAQADLEYVPYTFIVDRGGKVAKVE